MTNQQTEEVDGLSALADAMRPGETFGELVTWGTAHGCTTIADVFALRQLEANGTTTP